MLSRRCVTRSDWKGSVIYMDAHKISPPKHVRDFLFFSFFLALTLFHLTYLYKTSFMSVSIKATMAYHCAEQISYLSSFSHP